MLLLSGRQTKCCAAERRLEGGELEFAEHAHNEDMGGIESLVDLDAGFADDEEYDEVCSHMWLLSRVGNTAQTSTAVPRPVVKQ